jgi:hypothetical protein
MAKKLLDEEMPEFVKLRAGFGEQRFSDPFDVLLQERGGRAGQVAGGAQALHYLAVV